MSHTPKKRGRQKRAVAVQGEGPSPSPRLTVQTMTRTEATAKLRTTESPRMRRSILRKFPQLKNVGR